MPGPLGGLPPNVRLTIQVKNRFDLGESQIGFRASGISAQKRTAIDSSRRPVGEQAAGVVDSVQFHGEVSAAMVCLSQRLRRMSSKKKQVPTTARQFGSAFASCRRILLSGPVRGVTYIELFTIVHQ
jgi:hypothetical protein